MLSQTTQNTAKIQRVSTDFILSLECCFTGDMEHIYCGVLIMYKWLEVIFKEERVLKYICTSDIHNFIEILYFQSGIV